MSDIKCTGVLVIALFRIYLYIFTSHVIILNNWLENHVLSIYPAFTLSHGYPCHYTPRSGQRLLIIKQYK